MSDRSPSHLARERLRTRARRISRLRRRVVAGALATFVLAFGVIAYDGSMGASSTSTQAATAESGGSSSTTGTASSGASATTGADSTAADSDDATTSADSTSANSDPTPMTTQQS